MWELSRSHAGNYTGGLHSFICFICPSPDSSALGLVSHRFYLWYMWWGTTNRRESLLLLSLIHSPMTQDSHKGVWSSGFGLLVSQHSILFFRVQLNCSLQALEFRLSQHICGQVCTEFTEFGKLQRSWREPVLLQIALFTNFLAPCWE